MTSDAARPASRGGLSKDYMADEGLRVSAPGGAVLQSEHALTLGNLTDSQLSKLLRGEYHLLPSQRSLGRDKRGFLEDAHTALRASLLEEAARRSLDTVAHRPLDELRWEWPWNRHSDHQPNPSDPSIQFDLDLSLQIASLATVSYCQAPNIVAWNCSRCLNIPDFDPDIAVYDASWDLQAYSGWLSSRDTGEEAMVVVFRGTDAHSIYNWAENLRATKTDFQLPYPGAEGAEVHSGFFRSYNDSILREHVLESVKGMMKQHPGAALHVIGHSLGGAMASICAMEMRLSMGIEEVHVSTFGSPRVGNPVFHDLFKNVTGRSLRFTHNNDIVPSVPTLLMGFQHVRTELWEVELAYDKTRPSLQLMIVCDGSGEDPDCHLGQCGYGICTSVYNHLHYLGLRMGAESGTAMAC